MSRRLEYPGAEHAGAWVELPDEWRGEHLLRRNQAVAAAAHYQDETITVAAISLAIADGWGGIPGLEGADPAQWNFELVPISLLRWMEAVVWLDFLGAFAVPKAP